MSGSGPHYCPACQGRVRRFRPGPAGRPAAKCPHCRSLERHRFLSLLLGVLAHELDDVDTMVEIAPSPQSTAQLDRVPARRRLRFDIGYDNRAVHALASITDLPLPDASVDLLVCFHVLEHVPDDRAAMREIARVLSPNGIALLQVPIRVGVPTDEDPSADRDERTRRFGQHDHVRYYGDDFEERLVEAGLGTERLTPVEVLGQRAVLRFGLISHEFVWVVRRGTRRVRPLAYSSNATGLTLALDALVDENVALRENLRVVRRRVERLDSRLRALTPPSPPDMAGRAVSTVRRLISR